MRREGDVSSRTATRQLNILYEKHEGVCQGCRHYIPRSLATREHIIDLSDGGSSDMSNLTLFCKQCNFEKARSKPKNWSKTIADQINRTIERQARGLRLVGSDPRDRERVSDTWTLIIQVGITGTIRRQQIGAKLVGGSLGDIMYSSLLSSKKKSGKDYVIASA